MDNMDKLFSEDFSSNLSDLENELVRIKDLAKGVGSSLSGAFQKAIIDGKSLRSLLSDIAKKFADIALKAALKPIGNFASSMIEQLFSAANPALNNVKPFAKGGVIASPTYFPLNSGFGVAGEAGPEAILPLKRTKDGRLGVASSNSAPINISMNIQTNNAQSFIGAEAEISAMLLRAVKRGARAS